MIENINKKMHQDEFNQKYVQSSLKNSEFISSDENQYSSNRIINQTYQQNSSNFPILMSNLITENSEMVLNHNSNINKYKDNSSTKKSNKVSTDIDTNNIKGTMQEYISSLQSNNENQSQIANYSTTTNDKDDKDIVEQSYSIGNATSPKSVSSQCSSATAASMSLPSNCNLNCENGSLLLAYSPPNSSTSSSSAKSYTSANDYKLNAVRFEALKHDVSNFSPNASRSPSGERSKSNGTVNSKKNDKESRNSNRKDVIPQRKRRDFIPEELKDESYWERRRKNNLAAKRSREKRRLNDIVLEAKVMELTRFNNVLKLKLELIIKNYKVSEEEAEKIYEENKVLFEACEHVEMPDLTNDSSGQDALNLTETDNNKGNESLDDDIKMSVDNKRFSSKSSCSSNSSMNENSSGEEGNKRKKLFDMDRIKNNTRISSLLTMKSHEKRTDETNFKFSTNIETKSKSLRYPINNASNDDHKPIDLAKSLSNGKTVCNSNISDNSIVKTQYPLLYGQLCRAISGATEINEKKSMNRNMILSNNISDLETMKSIESLLPNIHTNKTCISEKNKVLHGNLLMATSFQNGFPNHSFSDVLLAKQVKEEKQNGEKMIFTNEIKTQNINDNNKDVINTILNEYFKNKQNQSKRQITHEIQNESDTFKFDESSISNINNYKDVKNRINNSIEHQNLCSSSNAQLHVNTFALNQNTYDTSISGRNKKRHVQGDLLKGYNKSVSLQHVFNRELISPSSSSDDLSYDDANCSIQNQRINDETEVKSHINTVEQSKCSSREYFSSLNYPMNGKIRKMNSKSSQNHNYLISTDEGKNLEKTNNNSFHNEIDINSNSSSISIQEILNLNFASGNSAHQKVLINGKLATTSVPINNPFATNGDNMPLKLRFKMLQLKTSEVN